MTATSALDTLERPHLVPVAFEHMLTGMIVTRALLPQVVLTGGDLDLMNEVAIDEWMGASPVYTRRMRALMGIEGDDVPAIMKALQLDVGFVHQYMDVGYRVVDAQHGEFWLAHCGALLDAEPHGEERVFGMCHTIEDPTFDATALATNPRARIRPIHRPPRSPADREPHCHWTITIDPANEPVGAMPLTEAVAALPLAGVRNDRAGDDGPGRPDYRGPFDPDFRLADLSSATLAAVAREFQVQAHLLVAATELTLRQRFDADRAADLVGAAWLGAGWIASERLAARLGVSGGGLEGVARALELHPLVPPGFERDLAVADDGLRLRLRAEDPALLDPAAPGWNGALARGERRGLEGMARGVDRRARLDRLTVTDGQAEAMFGMGAEPAPEPDAVALVRIGLVSQWSFDVTDPVAGAGV